MKTRWNIFIHLPDSSLDGRVALVTGAGSRTKDIGNGSAISILLARRGAHVLLLDTDLEASQQTQSMIEGEGGTAIALCCDVSQSDDCQAAATRQWILVLRRCAALSHYSPRVG